MNDLKDFVEERILKLNIAEKRSLKNDTTGSIENQKKSSL